MLIFSAKSLLHQLYGFLYSFVIFLIISDVWSIRFAFMLFLIYASISLGEAEAKAGKQALQPGSPSGRQDSSHFEPWHCLPGSALAGSWSHEQPIGNEPTRLNVGHGGLSCSSAQRFPYVALQKSAVRLYLETHTSKASLFHFHISCK